MIYRHGNIHAEVVNLESGALLEFINRLTIQQRVAMRDNSNLEIQIRLREVKDDAFRPKTVAHLCTDLAPRSAAFDPIENWLRRHEALARFARFALNCLATPPIIDDCERSFSLGREPFHYKRSQLLSDVIEAWTCLRGLLRQTTFEDGWN